MMQRVLFGGHAADGRYTDLHSGELAWLTIILAIAVAIGATPALWLESPVGTDLHRAALETHAVAQVAVSPYSESQRMELRALIRLASEIIAYYWPMRTFVHHNPLHGLEDLPFEQAAQMAQRWRGGNSFLSGDVFRDYVRAGRILPRHVDASLKPLALSQQVKLGIREINHLDVLRACLLGDTSTPPPDMLDAQLARHPDRNTIAALAHHLSSIARQPTLQQSTAEQDTVGNNETLASWCDRILGTQINDAINREMVKWCEAFLDEGHAPWPMPGRENGFYAAWKLLVQKEWSPCGIKSHREKLARLPAQAEDSLLETLGALGIDATAWQNYFSLHLAALAGWASFIKWRADQNEYAWQTAYPNDLVQYLAVRLWYERELVHQSCRQALAIDGNVKAIAAEMQKPGSPLLAGAERNGTMHGNPPSAAWQLVLLARALELEPALLHASSGRDLTHFA